MKKKLMQTQREQIAYKMVKLHEVDEVIKYLEAKLEWMKANKDILRE